MSALWWRLPWGGITVGNAGQVTKIGTLTTGPKSRSSRRMTSSTNIVRFSICWVTHKTWHILTQNCLDAVSTTFTFAGGLSVICRKGGEHPSLRRGPSSFTIKNTEELIHQLENTLDLTLESPSYLMVPTSLVNLDIVLPHQEFRKRRGLPELPSGRRTRAKRIQHGWSEGIGRSRLVPADPYLSPG